MVGLPLVVVRIGCKRKKKEIPRRHEANEEL